MAESRVDTSFYNQRPPVQSAPDPSGIINSLVGSFEGGQRLGKGINDIVMKKRAREALKKPKAIRTADDLALLKSYLPEQLEGEMMKEQRDWNLKNRIAVDLFSQVDGDLSKLGKKAQGLVMRYASKEYKSFLEMKNAKQNLDSNAFKIRLNQVITANNGSRKAGDVRAS